jgi:hypothetical protein
MTAFSSDSSAKERAHGTSGRGRGFSVMPKEPRKTEVPEDEKPGVKEQREAAQQQPEGPGEPAKGE